MAPLQAYAATPEPVTQSTQQDTAEKPKKTMTAMTDADMDGISAQGLNNELLEVITKDHTGKGDGVEVLGKMAKLMNPLLAFLEADTSMKDVVYDPATAAAVVNPDGSITLSLPSSIGEISFKNIRPVAAGSIGGPSMGSITLRDIQFNNTKITLTHRP